MLIKSGNSYYTRTKNLFPQMRRLRPYRKVQSNCGLGPYQRLQWKDATQTWNELITTWGNI